MIFLNTFKRRAATATNAVDHVVINQRTVTMSEGTSRYGGVPMVELWVAREWSHMTLGGANMMVDHQ